MRSDTLVVLLGLGVLGGLAWRAGFFDERRRAAAAGGAAGGGYDADGNPIGGLAGALAPLAGLGGVLGVGGAIGAAGVGAVEAYGQAGDETQQRLQTIGDKLKGTIIRVDPFFTALAGHSDQTASEKRRDRRKANVFAQQVLQGESDATELYVTQVADALARDDVQQWRFSSDPVKGPALEVWYGSRSGNPDGEPVRLPVPAGAINPGAVLAEWSSRVFGRFQRAGVGPVYKPVPTFGRNAVGFSTANPQAPVRFQQPELTAELLALQNAQARSLRRPESDRLA